MIKRILLALLLFAGVADAATITTVTIKETESVTTTNYPLTFAMPFKKGDVVSGTGIVVEHDGSDLTTQFDIKRTWADGSVKHGIISVVIPEVTADVGEVLIIKNGALNSSAGFMDKTAILATDVESVTALTNLSGSANPTTASSSLRTAINDGDVDYWMQGSVCTEVLEDVDLTPNDNLHSRWEARFYPGTSFGIRIATITESVNINATGISLYDVTITQGSAIPTEVYSFTGNNHAYGSRWIKHHWLGTEPPETVVEYETAYLSSTGLVANLDISLTPDSAKITSMYNVHTGPASSMDSGDAGYIYGYTGGDDIDGAGNILRPFPSVGGRDDLGLYPTWTAMYFLNYSVETTTLMVGNGYQAGLVGALHFREVDNTKSLYMKPAVDLNARPTIRFAVYNDDNSTHSLPTPVGSAPKNYREWNPDRAHQGSFAYVPYLLTGEHYLMEEVSFFASFTAGFNSWGRDGDNDTQDFSSEFSEGSAAGIIHDESRAMAWGLRNIADAASILPDSEADMIAYYERIASNNVHWHYLAQEHQPSTTGHGMDFIRATAENYWAPNPYTNFTRYTAPWQHDFNVIVMTDLIRKEEGVSNLSEAIVYRDTIGAFTVGRFTNHPGFNKFDGVSYNWPLSGPKPNADDWMYGITWRDYYGYIYENNLLMGDSYEQVMNHTDYTQYTVDGESYFYIAQAALAGLTHLSNGSEAYNMVLGHDIISEVQEKPQWGAITPQASYVVPTCSEAPSSCTDQSTCEAASWYWYNSACEMNEQLFCVDSANYCTEISTCEAASWYWHNDECHADQEASCTTNPNLCVDQAECEAASWHWYDDQCSATAEPTCTENASYCLDQSTCETASWYWYNAQCNTNQEPVGCDSSHLDLCTDQSTCEAATGNWCTDVCQAESCGSFTQIMSGSFSGTIQ